MPYISGIKIPENRVYYSSITGQYKRTENLPYFILVININELKKFHLNLSKIPRFYNLDLDGQTIRVHNYDGFSFSILIDKTDFSKESYNQLVNLLTNKNLIHDFDKK